MNKKLPTPCKLIVVVGSETIYKATAEFVTVDVIYFNDMTHSAVAISTFVFFKPFFFLFFFFKAKHVFY